MTKQRKYEEVIKDLAEKYPRIDLEPYAKSLRVITDREQRQMETKISDVAKMLKKKPTPTRKIMNRLEELRYVKMKWKSKSGKVRLFLSVEKEGTCWGRDEIETAIVQNIDELLARVKKDPKVKAVVKRERLDMLKKLLETNLNKALDLYVKLIDDLALAGLKGDLKRVERKGVAFRVGSTPKGELAAEKIAEMEKVGSKKDKRAATRDGRSAQEV